MAEQKRVSLIKAGALFGGATAYFYLLLFTLLPFLKAHFSLHPGLYWFITGFFLFIPLFLYALIASRLEGNSTLRELLAALEIRPLLKRDWIYALGGLFLSFVLTGLMFGISMLMTKYLSLRPLETTPWFMKMRPFQGSERLLLLVWMVMFFFNIVGEEILWRGYIQARLEGRYAWIFCSIFWALFHLPFGLDIIIMALPVLFIIPYIFFKTRNTSIGIFIHAIYNGPIFILIALGLLE